MTTYNHTAIAAGAAANAATFNGPLGQLDAAIRKNNFAATAAPVVGDDAADGYTVGSLWIDVTHDRAYVCVDASAGAAVWQVIGGGWVYVPAFYSSTDWDGDSKSGASGTIDLSAVFGVPAGVKAVTVLLYAKDETVQVLFGAHNGDGYTHGVVQLTQVANVYVAVSGTVYCDANGDIAFYQSDELDAVCLYITGYFY